MLLVGIYLADWQHFVIPSKVPYLLAIAWISLYLRQLRWRDVGFRLYRDWPTTLAIGVAAGVAMEMLELFCTQPLLVRITGQMPDLSAFSRVAGNVRWLAISLALTWTLFAFGEELVFRGYLMDRIAGLLGRTARGWAVALLTASLVFGLSHFQQGITGVSENFVDGLILGALYLRLGGNLAVPIVAHGVTDTVDLVLLFLHRYPGLH
ncbi:MAG TPA: CPBP family intramembrane glutamic endopeptidase [Steroidobacteraceae bacterium]|jgi:membrane protease YdiL (CAAX protease family)|nr:CPBP family intramembrane glutamic endopeptidase [Steroidobacteraceae bacterium]